MRREAVFAHQGWYPRDGEKVRQALETYLVSDAPPRPAVAVLAPHAGWVYSGSTAGQLYAELEVPERVLVLCPMHQHGGPRVAVWAKGTWDSPLGPIPVDDEFADCLLQDCASAREDYDSHLTEHAIEIQLPFLKARNDAVHIVPVRLGHLGIEEIEQLGATLAACISRADSPTLIVASTDMSHEGDYDRVLSQDIRARRHIAACDAPGLVTTVEAHRITMCGYIPAALAMVTARHLGATRVREVAYTTSADISGRYDYVVGYLAARIDRPEPGDSGT